MKEILLNFAEMPFVIKTHDDEIAAWLAEHFSGEEAENASGTEIEIDPDSTLTVVDSYQYLGQPPEVGINGNLLEFRHPCYKGVLSLTERKGKVWFSGREFLISYLRTVVTVTIVNCGGLALHSSCILRNGKTYIFTGYSGAGKSTVIKLTADPIIYSDELTLLKKDENGIFSVHHSPFRSEFHTEYLPPTSDIAGIFFITQDSQVFLEKMPVKQALFEILPMVFFPVNKTRIFESKIFGHCADLLNQVPVFNLHFRKDDTFWECIEQIGGGEVLKREV
ncbi:hypothetical protein [Phosphitispora fastidiosa]|uniref:hypothetical protein n=1 Tax=Phosphitispora fastidiosa TaxID=2837202 RepID=UPI001E45B2B3|nr:hypothetical protein [Phosphitispora fastidiosa]MBU7007243.1 hypothetical protein [Phosphitispora fastidiosa]